MSNLVATHKSLKKSIVVCPDCQEPYVVYRKYKKRRVYKEGHLKNLWCYKCKADKKFIQLSDKDTKYDY